MNVMGCLLYCVLWVVRRAAEREREREMPLALFLPDQTPAGQGAPLPAISVSFEEEWQPGGKERG